MIFFLHQRQASMQSGICANTHANAHTHMHTHMHVKERRKKEHLLAFPNRPRSSKPMSPPLPTPNTGRWRRHPTSATLWQCVLKEGTMSLRLFLHFPQIRIAQIPSWVNVRRKHQGNIDWEIQSRPQGLWIQGDLSV